MKSTAMRYALCGVVTVLVPQLGCGIRYQFGTPPPAVHLADPVRRCTAANQIVVRGALAQVRDTRQVFWYLRDARQTLQGLTFYRGGQRLRPRQVLALLRNPTLDRDYMEQYQRRARKATSYTAIGGTLVGAGLAGTFGGLTAVLAGIRYTQDNEKLWRRHLVGGLTAIIVGGVLSTVGGFLVRDGLRRKDLAKSRLGIFIAPSLRPALQRAIAHYNRWIAQRCAQATPGTAAPPHTTAPPTMPPTKAPPPPPPPPPPQP